MPGSADIARWLVDRISAALGVDRSRIDPRRSFHALGLDSAMLLGISGDLQHWLGVRVTPNLPYDYPSVAELAAHLAEEVQIQAGAPGDAV